jgi:cytochrome c oxidase subunit 3
MRSSIPVSAQRAGEAAGTRFVGIVLFLASWAVLFAGLFFSYGLLRLKSAHWPPVGVPQLPLFLPGLATALLVSSSATLWASLKKNSRVLYWLTILLGVVFLMMQSLTWVEVWESGLQIDSGAYGGVFYLMTTFHAVHIVGGLGALLYFLPAALRRGPRQSESIGPAVLFWHFLDVVWCLMFVAVYVL